MNETAHAKTQVLICDIDSYLAQELAASLLSQNCAVFGVGKKPPPASVLQDRDFTLLDINLAQPLPAYLPQFDFIFLFLNPAGNLTYQAPKLTTADTNIISQAKEAKSEVLIIADIETDTDFWQSVNTDESHNHIKLFLVGDVYGPQMSFEQKPESNRLGRLIAQAAAGDKIILEKEGLSMIYPAYISDAIFAINKFVFSPNSKYIHLIVSEEPQTELSVAYTIQNIAELVLNRQLNLYYSGPETLIKPESGPQIRVYDLGFTPKVKLEQGLKNTLQAYLLQKERQEKHQFAITGSSKSHNSIKSAPKLEEAKKLRSRLPSFNLTLPSPKSRYKKAFVLLILILMLTIGKTIIDLYLGAANIKGAQSALLSGNFKDAKSKAQSAKNSFGAAYNKLHILTYPLSFVFPKKVQGVNFVLKSAETTASSLTYFVDGAQILVKDLQIVTAKEQKEGLDLETPSANFLKAGELTSQAQELAQVARLNGVHNSQTEKLEAATSSLAKIATSSYELVNLTGDIIGKGGKKTYLVVLQNNTELRPGGGFIGNFGLVQFESGKLSGISVEDIYTIDGQLKEKITPPAQLTEKLGITNLYLRDSNWTVDFTVNAATIRDFYKKETGRDVDGVIAIDLTFVQDLLEKIGPVKLADYNEEITDKNLFEKGETYAEIGFFPGSTQKRDFFSSLTRTLLDGILTSFQNPQTKTNGKTAWLALVETARDALAQKHLMVSFDNANLASFVKTKGWDHPLPPALFNPADDSTETRDFLALSEANLGANKANRYLDRKIDYEMTIGRDADLVGKLKITYTNNSLANTWPAGPYVNFLRVCLPPTTSLIGFTNGQDSDITKVNVSNQGSLTVLATYIEVPIKSTREVVFTYRIAKNIQLEKTPTYHLYVQKQPGTEKDPLKFTFNLPSYIEVKSVNGDKSYQDKQNVTIETDLSVDREFEIEVAKK